VFSIETVYGVEDSTKIRKASTQCVLYKILQHLFIARNCVIPLKNKNKQISGTKVGWLKKFAPAYPVSVYGSGGGTFILSFLCPSHITGYSKITSLITGKAPGHNYCIIVVVTYALLPVLLERFSVVPTDFCVDYLLQITPYKFYALLLCGNSIHLQFILL
jgi:hypothetical protein